ncbi:export ABC transporter ATP-binding protein [Virgibacillus profundi]|uniref:Export ABC transporter ATP-binding protein n=1 Tax=Virgibacillus profundi TaxID=2024555 RepID=A0A2A2IFB6_9BACI|nr:ABC transporter ATP-binding protein [Virgibacillus profundi]PAV29773.1 export ABC transporter ATP-binding protein [Virgibacillus profundi]PXY53945.1 ABC transporter ATP-binding protein [Virgibacillus profundi]
MLELVDLSKKFKQMYAVKNLNMFIEKGEIVGLLGPNGAGKSTAISMLSSLVEPTNGDGRFNNISILKRPAPLRKVIGMVPQEIALYNDLTAEENLRFFGRIYRLKGNVLKKKIDEILELIGLADRRKDVVEKYSGGMKRRLNIGVALLHDPEVIIMDEPTVGIDPQSRNYILETVKRLNAEKQMTVLYTSHYMEEVEFLCDRIYIMDKGNLIASGTKDEIKRILSAEKTISIKAERLNFLCHHYGYFFFFRNHTINYRILF